MAKQGGEASEFVRCSDRVVRFDRTPYTDLDLGNPRGSDDDLLDFMMAPVRSSSPPDRRHAERREAVPPF